VVGRNSFEAPIATIGNCCGKEISMRIAKIEPFILHVPLTEGIALMLLTVGDSPASSFMLTTVKRGMGSPALTLSCPVIDLLPRTSARFMALCCKMRC